MQFYPMYIVLLPTHTFMHIHYRHRRRTGGNLFVQQQRTKQNGGVKNLPGVFCCVGAVGW
jgi:hypothetical protein